MTPLNSKPIVGQIMYCKKGEVLKWLRNDEIESAAIIVPEEERLYQILGVLPEEIDGSKTDAMADLVTNGNADEFVASYIDVKGYGVTLRNKIGTFVLTPFL